MFAVLLILVRDRGLSREVEKEVGFPTEVGLTPVKCKSSEQMQVQIPGARGSAVEEGSQGWRWTLERGKSTSFSYFPQRMWFPPPDPELWLLLPRGHIEG